jgi:phosphoglycerol transferase MdoB-like AlkP superfamily enzyme
MSSGNGQSSRLAGPSGAGSGLPWTRGRYGFVLLYFGSLLAVWLGLRVLLYARFGHGSTGPAGDVLKAFLIGCYRDGWVGLVMCVPLLGWFALVSNRAFGRPWHRWLMRVGFSLFWLVQIFLLATEYFFFDEFLSRFNTVAVDYLLYPHEVFINIWDSYPVAWVVAGCLLLSAGWVWLAFRRCAGMWQEAFPARLRFGLLAGLVGVCALLSQTMSLKGVRFSKDRLMNELANNGAIAFAAAAWTRHLDYAAFYRTLPLEEAYARTRRLLAEPGSAYVEHGNDIRRQVVGDPARPRLNVVIHLQESLGSEFWGSLGRKEPTLTPEMDKLAGTDGLLFTQIYATGNRTVRGFEGVLSSFPPLPGDSIVKRDLSENVETLARILKRDGYQTLFLYGGRGLFDGMRAYALQNGYDRFVEQKHFPKPVLTTIWGVSDEDLMARSIEEFRELAKTGQPFFGTVLSVSNHKPYTYPKGRIPENPDARLRDHAVKYSDYALGQFFQAARKESFWTNTIFVVVADHGARVYGSQSIPIHSYEIPLLIAGPAAVKKPARVPRLGCSMDVAPTLLGLIGRPYESLCFGHDLLRSPPETDRVLINHNRDIGLYAHERLVVLGLRQGVEFYEGDPKQVEMKRLSQPGPLERELEQDCTALFQVADHLYMNRRFRIDRR